MRKLIEKASGFKNEVLDFVKASTENEIKIALIINTVLTILLAFVAGSAYELIKFLVITWTLILSICTIMLRTTTREAVQEKHEKMYAWIKSFGNKYLSRFSMRSSYIGIGIVLAAFIIIFAKITLGETIFLLIMNSLVIIGTCLALKQSWTSKYIKPFLAKYFTPIPFAMYAGLLTGSLLFYSLMVSCTTMSFSLNTLTDYFIGTYLAILVFSFLDKTILKKEKVSQS